MGNEEKGLLTILAIILILALMVYAFIVLVPDSVGKRRTDKVIYRSNL